MYTDQREAYRQSFFMTWLKYLKQQPLTGLEQQLLTVILDHPQYHHLLDPQYQQQEFDLEENPFFHMSLHLAIREQIATNRPVGVAKIYQDLLQAGGIIHEIEHQMMQSLAEILWQAHQTGTPGDEQLYLKKLATLTA